MKTAVFREYLAGKAFPRGTRKTFCSANLYYLIHTFCTHTIYTHITHKCLGVLLRENPSQTPWELEIIIPIYLYTYACGFPQLLCLHFHTIERLIAQTLTTPFQSVKWGFGAVGKHWKKTGFGRCNRAYYGIWRDRQDMVPRSFVGVGAWRAAERFFVEFFDFLFNNTSACYLVFASFFSTRLHSILLLCCYDYELE